MTRAPDMPGSMYFFTLAIGCIGVAFVGIGLWSGMAALVGGDPLDGLNYGGGIGTALGFALLYIERATRWEKVSPGIRELARRSMTVTLVVAALCTVVCLYLALAYRSYPYLPMIFGLPAALCQIGSFYWLARARPKSFP